jgi:hypothetical protein
MANFRNNHWMNNSCMKNHSAWEEEQKAKKQRGLMASFLKPKAPPVAPTVPAPTLIATTSTSSPDLLKSDSTCSQPVTLLPDQGDTLKVLEHLTSSLPSLPPSATTIFDAFKNPSCLLEDGTMKGDALWEEVNPIIHRVFGYGTGVDEVVVLVEVAGREGIEAFARFVRYFVEERGVGFALFRSKVELVMEGIKRM